MKRRHLIIFFLVFCLTATLIVGVTSSAEYDPWVDGNDDGIIDIVDIVNLAIRFGEEGTPINKTALILELQSKVDILNASPVDLVKRFEALETGGYIGEPAYDSGWVELPEESSWSKTNLTHNVGTTEVLVYMIGKSDGGSIHQKIKGQQDAVDWEQLTNTTISVVRQWEDVWWDYVRVMIWKILPTLSLNHYFPSYSILACATTKQT